MTYLIHYPSFIVIDHKCKKIFQSQLTKYTNSCLLETFKMNDIIVAEEYTFTNGFILLLRNSF